MKTQTLGQFLAELKSDGFTLNLVNTLVLSAIFFIGFFVALPYFITTGISGFEFKYGLILLGWGLFSITAYMHRLLAHNCSQHISKPIHIWGNTGSVLAVQDDAARWAGGHRVHHAKEDQHKDPYSVKKSNNPFIGAMWAHFLTYFFNAPHEELYVKRAAQIYNKSKIVHWFARFYLPLLVLVHVAMPFAIGFAFFEGFESGMRLFAVHFCFVALLHQITWTVNSVTHIFGEQMGKCSAKNTWWYFAPMGEGNYHSGHHMFPFHYRNGSPWYIFDPTGWLLWTFEKVHLVGKLNRKPRYELQSRTLSNYQAYLQLKYPDLWLTWQTKTEEMRSCFDGKITAFKTAKQDHVSHAKQEMQHAYAQLLKRLHAFRKAAQTA